MPVLLRQVQLWMLHEPMEIHCEQVFSVSEQLPQAVAVEASLWLLVTLMLVVGRVVTGVLPPAWHLLSAMQADPAGQ